jgi:hypothetical protein
VDKHNDDKSKPKKGTKRIFSFNDTQDLAEQQPDKEGEIKKENKLKNKESAKPLYVCIFDDCGKIFTTVISSYSFLEI